MREREIKKLLNHWRDLTSDVVILATRAHDNHDDASCEL